ncbi:hypothetical protein [Deinococcus marmoris]|uniref:hypothetical protein n=1 Tax=Deinococcus marmoris TaxID=249408 RepID=UPI000495CBB3|nr:hypothetical protein [Deinococcus marmoris]
MNQAEQVGLVQLQRQATVAAIEQAEAWAEAHRTTHPTAFSNCLSLYLDSTNARTVSELAHLEAKARAYLQHLQSEQ